MHTQSGEHTLNTRDTVKRQRGPCPHGDLRMCITESCQKKEVHLAGPRPKQRDSWCYKNREQGARLPEAMVTQPTDEMFTW